MHTSDLAREREEKLAELRQTGAEAATEREAARIGMPYMNVADNPRSLSPETIGLIPRETAERAQIAALSKQHSSLRVGVVYPENEETRDALGHIEQQGFSVTPVLISHASLHRALEEYKDVVPHRARAPSGILTLTRPKAALKSMPALSTALPLLLNEGTSALLETLIASGLAMGASDVHLEPRSEGARVRLRLDGILQDAVTMPQSAHRQLLSRIKVLSSVPLNVPSIAHDGRFTIKKGSLEAEARVSILPSPEGEYVVLRLLDPEAIALEVDALGLEDDLWHTLKGELARPNGIILTTGPTGSGKTTTLYALLKYLNTPEVKIITLENPIEYHLEGVSQTQIAAEGGGYGFADGVRSALRHDPDIILVGEIRDEETADAALHAALTGHLVFSTLHTNDAAGAVPRFLDLNAKPEILASALRSIIAQRLVRTLCAQCRTPLAGKEKDEAYAHIQQIFKRYPALAQTLTGTTTLYRAAGCASCSETGYHGRTGIFELFVVDGALEELITTSPSHRTMLNHAYKQGFQNMYVNGLRKVVRGLTTLEEIRRIASPPDVPDVP